MQRLFADGGTIAVIMEIGGRRRVLGNPSPVGITWAWVLVDEERELARASGYLLTPVGHSDHGNEIQARGDVAEYYALLRGITHLSTLKPPWSGAVCSDSALSLRRALGAPASTELIPRDWQGSLHVARSGLRRLWPVTVGSHPSPEELEEGVKQHPNGTAPPRLVSAWNVLADDLCRQQQRPALEAWHEQYRTTAEPRLVAAVLAAIERLVEAGDGEQPGAPVGRGSGGRDTLRARAAWRPGPRPDPGHPSRRPARDDPYRRTDPTFSWVPDAGAGDAATGESGD
jgi:hypothetical protein